MVKFRNGVFETNSSSTHSVSIRGCNKNNFVEPDEEEIKWELNYDSDDGYLHVSLGEYGWEVESYDRPIDKLSYLITMICETSGITTSFWGEKENEKELSRTALYENEYFNRLNEKLVNMSNTNGIFVDSMEGYIVHQSHEDYYNASEFLADYGIDDPIRFIFDSNIVVHTDNDNH